MGKLLRSYFFWTYERGSFHFDVLVTLIQAIVLVILVIFIFLQDWRSTVIPAVTIPVSLIGTFAFVKLLGFSVNTLTLFGITLATGLVVDDALEDAVYLGTDLFATGDQVDVDAVEGQFEGLPLEGVLRLEEVEVV